MSTETESVIQYSKRDRGGYFATTEDRKIWIVRQTDEHMRTSRYFRWTAKGRGRTGSGATRDEAVRNAMSGMR